MRPEQLEQRFLEAAGRCTSSYGTHGPLEITAVLNQMRRNESEEIDNLIDHIDELMDSLFRRKVLSCPGHRWLPEHPDSIRNHLTTLFNRGFIFCDAPDQDWDWCNCTSHFYINR